MFQGRQRTRVQHRREASARMTERAATTALTLLVTWATNGKWQAGVGAHAWQWRVGHMLLEQSRKERCPAFRCARTLLNCSAGSLSRLNQNNFTFSTESILNENSRTRHSFSDDVVCSNSFLTSSSAFSLREAAGCQRREWGGLRSNCSLRMGRIQEMQNAPGVFGGWFILGRNQNGPRPVIHVAKKQPNWPEICALFVTKQC